MNSQPVITLKALQAERRRALRGALDAQIERTAQVSRPHRKRVNVLTGVLCCIVVAALFVVGRQLLDQMESLMGVVSRPPPPQWAAPAGILLALLATLGAYSKFADWIVCQWRGRPIVAPLEFNELEAWVQALPHLTAQARHDLATLVVKRGVGFVDLDEWIELEVERTGYSNLDADRTRLLNTVLRTATLSGADATTTSFGASR